jgi:hypothetical protein
MRTNPLDVTLRAAARVTLLAILLAGCSKPVPPQEDASPSSPAVATPEASPPAQPQPAPQDTPAAPTQPSQEAPPPADPSAAANPALATEPALDAMRLATPSAKMGVPAELRYSFESDVTGGQPALLHLAAVPRGQGGILRMSVQQDKGLEIAAGPLRSQKANASEVYRQQVSVTKTAAGPASLRVLIRMEMGEDSTFGYFTIPLDGSGASESRAQTQDSVKQR